MRNAALTLACLLAAGPAAAETLIVGNKAEDTVSFVDLATGEEIVRRETGRAPHEIAVSPDGSFAVVVSYRDGDYVGNALHTFDIASAEPRDTVSLGESKAPHGLQWIPRTDDVIVTAEASREVVIVDPRGRIRDRIPTEEEGSHMVAVAPDGLTAYVANIGSGSFSVIEIPAARKVREVQAGQGTEAITVSPDGSTLYVGNNEGRSIMAFDTESLKRRKRVGTEGVPIRVETSPDGESLAVSFYDRGEIAFFDAATLERTGTVELGEDSMPVTLLYAPSGDRLWAAATGLAQVVEIDPEAMTEVRRFDVGQGSDGLGYSPVELEDGD